MNPKAHRSLYDPRDGEIPPPPRPSGVAEIIGLLLVLTLGLVVLVAAVMEIGAGLAG